MVRLTITPALVAALEQCSELEDDLVSADPNEPFLDKPAVGRPITHSQVLAISKHLRKHAEAADTSSKLVNVAYDLDTLLRGSQVYIEPRAPKPEPTSEYKALMARLRAEEEERNYTRMLNTSSAPSLSSSLPSGARSLTSPYAQIFPDSHASPSSLSSANYDASGVLHDEVSFRDVNRQLALIANVLISIVACSVAIWFGTWHWSVGWRLGASMGGSGLVGVAEVVVYMGYISRMGMAKEKERRKAERKRVSKTWVIEGRKGVVEKRVIGVEEDMAATGSDWVGGPRTIRQRARNKG